MGLLSGLSGWKEEAQPESRLRSPWPVPRHSCHPFFPKQGFVGESCVCACSQVCSLCARAHIHTQGGWSPLSEPVGENSCRWARITLTSPQNPLISCQHPRIYYLVNTYLSVGLSLAVERHCDHGNS